MLVAFLLILLQVGLIVADCNTTCTNACGNSCQFVVVCTVPPPVPTRIQDPDFLAICEVFKWIGILLPSDDCETNRAKITTDCCLDHYDNSSVGCDWYDREPSHFSASKKCCCETVNDVNGNPTFSIDGEKILAVTNLHLNGLTVVNDTLPTFPPTLKGLKLRDLVFGSQLIPSVLPATLQTLVYFNMNFQTGTTFPQVVNGAVAPQHIYLSKNGITGDLTGTSFASIKTMYIDEAVSGAIPALSSAPLLLLGLTNTDLSGPLPSLPTTVAVIKVTNNRFLTSFDSTVFNPLLTFISLEGNSFSSSIPNSIGSATILTHLNFYRNKLTGTIPTEISLNNVLEYFNVGSNLLDGAIPALNASSIRSIHLGTNYLTGSFTDINLNLHYLDISGNLITDLPWGIESLAQVKLLNIARNQIVGTLPADFIGRVPLLDFFDMSYNAYNGPLPALWSHTKFSVFDLSYNQFTGAPVFYTALATRTSIAGNRLTIPNSFNASTEQSTIIKNILYYGQPLTLCCQDTTIVAESPYLYPQDVDECSLPVDPCALYSHCVDGWAPRMSFTCACDDGFVQLANGSCVDENECLTGNWVVLFSANTGRPCFSQSSCLNTFGAYNCCATGLQNLDLVNGATCVDINECVTGDWAIANSANTGGPCVFKSECVNTDGGFECCPTGYYNPDPVNGTTCIDINECVTGDWANVASSSGLPCAFKSQCVNKLGGFDCCASGYENLDIVNGSTCVDINECFTGDWSQANSNNTGAPCSAQTACVNYVGSFNCCPTGYHNTDPSSTVCTDLNECLEGVHTCWADSACQNTIGSYLCCPQGEVFLNGSCTSCFSNWTVYEQPQLHSDLFPSLANFSVRQYFETCLGKCDDGQIISNRASLTVECAGLSADLLVEVTPCAFACKLDFKANAETTIAVLMAEFQRGDFLPRVLQATIGVGVTFGKKRQASQTLNLDSCTNSTQVMALIQALSQDILPNANPTYNLINNNGNCSVQVQASDPVNLGLAIGLPVGLGVLALLLIIALIAFYLSRPPKIDWTEIPDVVSWSFKSYEKSPSGWEYRGTAHTGYYHKSFDQTSSEFSKVKEMFEGFFHGKDIPFTEITAIYNRTLLFNFIGAFKIMRLRHSESPQIFTKQHWKEGDSPDPLRMWVYDQFKKRIKEFYGEDKPVPILPAVHATSIAVCEKIAETGFANLSKIDDGYYGKGIYFTTYAYNSLTYIATAADPGILVSWIIPGNAYPVTQHPRTDPDSLLGKPLKAGYNSHYITTDPEGYPLKAPQDSDFSDEIVIPQESQILPAFMFTLDKKETRTCFKRWVTRANQNASRRNQDSKAGRNEVVERN